MRTFFKWLWRRWKKLVHGINAGVAFVLMAFTYIFGLAPVAIIMRLLGRDLLDRGLRPDRSSQWLPKDDERPDIHRVQKQF